jgi:RNA polymerase sigma-70 factor (ECF subfamily)
MAPPKSPLQNIDLEACFYGDSGAWEAFMSATAGLVVAAVKRTIGGGYRAADLELEDIVQAIYLKLVRNDYRLLRTFDPKRASMSTWLTLVSRSTAIDTLRRQRPYLGIVDENMPQPSNEPPATPEIKLPLHILTNRQRAVLAMLYDDGRSVSEAAAMLGVNVQTIRSTKHKALMRLRAYFKTAESGDEPAPGTVRT